MKELNLYIIEKLRINKNTNLGIKFGNELLDYISDGLRKTEFRGNGIFLANDQFKEEVHVIITQNGLRDKISELFDIIADLLRNSSKFKECTISTRDLKGGVKFLAIEYHDSISINEKLKINKNTSINELMSFSEWCDYINKETDGCIFRNTRHFWIITLKKYEDVPVFPAHPELCIEVPPDKQNYWRWHKNNEEGGTSNKDITIYWGVVEKDYTIKLEDLDRDNVKRFTFTKNNADQIINLLNDIEADKK